jgi:uncharacterized coiled-coil protein SlyX
MRDIRLVLIATALLPGLVIAGNNTGAGANPNGKPFIELSGQIIEVEGEISSLQDQMDSLVGQVDSLDDRITANEAAIVALQAQNAAMQIEITNNAENVMALNAEIVDLQADNAALQAQIDDLGDADGALQDQINVNNGLIVSLQQTVSDLGTSLQGQIDNNNALIVAFENELSILDAQKQDAPIETCAAGEVITQINPDGSVICGILSGSPGTLSTYFVRAFAFADGYGGTNDLNCYGIGGERGATCFVLPNETGRAVTQCNDGDVAVNAGFSSGYNFKVWLARIEGNIARVSAVNTSTYRSYMLGWTTCLHQN